MKKVPPPLQVQREASSIWTSVIENVNARDRIEKACLLPEEQVERDCHTLKAEQMTLAQEAMMSIYVRAVRECRQFYVMKSKMANTANSTLLMPKVRFPRVNAPVEMRWEKAIIKKIRKATKADYISLNRKKSTIINGHAYWIHNVKGVDYVFMKTPKDIKYNCKNGYTNKIFEGEPDWVVQMGPRIEEIFQILRKEIGFLTKIRTAVCSIDRLDDKYFMIDANALPNEKRPILPKIRQSPIRAKEKESKVDDAIIDNNTSQEVLNTEINNDTEEDWRDAFNM